MKKSFKEGFTLIELSLSMVFIGILSLIIVYIIGSTIASYRRGLTISRINTVGMEVVDDIRVAVQNASSAPVTDSCEVFYPNATSSTAAQTACKNDGASNFVSITRSSRVRMKNGTITSAIPVFGAFCSGTYSYIWNSGYYDSSETLVIDAPAPATLTYRDDLGAIKTISSSERDPSKPFRLLKVRDEQRSVCVSVVRKYNESTATYGQNYGLPATISGDFNISVGYGAVSETPEDIILADNSNDLVLYSFNVAKPAESSTQKNMFYAISFILGTANGGINITESGKKCSVPADYANENYDYCSINKFNFAVQANGEAKGR